MLPTPLVSVTWLKDHLDDKHLILLDATIARVGQPQLIPSGDDVAIPGSKFFDLKQKFSAQASLLPNTCPTQEQFQKAARDLGIDGHAKIIVYDRHGLYSAARAWYLFRAFGHNQISVLDGGLPAWIKAGYPTASLNVVQNGKGNFIARYNSQAFADKKEVQTAIDEQQVDILDARSEGRFSGTTPEPRANTRSGHIPSSCNVHYASLLRDGFLRSDTELKTLLNAINNKKQIFSCGSGVTACILALASEKIGHKNYVVYDGSWAEWGSDESLPIV